MDKLSYSLGINIAEGLKQQGFKISDYASFTEGMQDAFKEMLKIEPSEIHDILKTEYEKIQKEAFETIKKEEEKFLSENSKKENVITLKSGLQYEIITKGSGAKPTISDNVTTHYHGTLPNGKVFDSSVERGQPSTFPVNGVIKGWTEALQLMNVGSKYRLFVPSNLAYGANGAGKDIGPHQALIFEVELIKIN